MPIFAVIAATALVGFYFSDIEVTVVAIELYRIVDTPMLVALPLFTLAGYLLAESNASKRLVRTAQAAIGWLPGGLGVIALVACAFFTAFTGASGVTIVAIGALLYPALVKLGFSDKFSLGLVTSSGSLGLLLAPSLPLILYGIVAQQSGLGEPFDSGSVYCRTDACSTHGGAPLAVGGMAAARAVASAPAFYNGGTGRCPVGGALGVTAALRSVWGHLRRVVAVSETAVVWPFMC